MMVSEVRRLRRERQMQPTPGSIEAAARQKAIDDAKIEQEAQEDGSPSE